VPKAVVEIRTGLLEHPAVKAWSSLQPARVAPESIHVLRQGRHTGLDVYRLTGVGPGGSTVIAKRCPTASIERTVYEEVIPHLPVTVPRYYGSREADAGSCWLFLEDVGGERYSELDEEHRALASRWLGLMHTSAAGVAAAARLPDGGPGRYLAYLRSTRETIVRNLANRYITAGDRPVREAIVAQLGALESRWSRVEASCEGVPSTLIHGDFRPKNAHIRRDHAGIRLFPLDWETAGWGVPAADLTRVDIAAYRSVVRERWPAVTMPVLRRLARAGRVFQLLAAMGWDSPGLARDDYDFVRHAMACLEVYQSKLGDAIRAAGLAR
jgi:hypothetical protein